MQPIVIVQPVSPVIPDISKQTPFEEPKSGSNKNFESPVESKKEFEPLPISKKDFDSAPEIEDEENELEFDRESDIGRWRFDWQVAELVIYRHEFGMWPADVPVETGLASYYEIRYFKEGVDRHGVEYSVKYAKHRAKKRLWLNQHEINGQISEADLDTPTTESNVVHFPARRANNSN